MDLFISAAQAQETGGAMGGGSPFGPIIMLVVFGLIFYFLLYRPQAKRVKEHKNLMAAMSKGDEVITGGGLVGKIVKISDDNDYILLALNENNEVTIKKDFVTAVLPKGTLKSL